LSKILENSKCKEYGVNRRSQATVNCQSLQKLKIFITATEHQFPDTTPKSLVRVLADK
jgi:hypothetical protein